MSLGTRRPRCGALLALAVWSCGEAPGSSEPAVELDTRPGYPATTSQLGSSLGNNLLKSCLATLVHPSWALTAAHCFSDVDPAARGTLKDFGRGFTVGDVELHPAAHPSGLTRLEHGWRRSEFVAAHDLALVPLRPPVLEATPVAIWPPRDDCSLDMPGGLIGELGLSEQGEPVTAEASVLGHVDASLLLGGDQLGRMLAARGPGVGPGDSGSGLTVSWAELAARAPECVPTESEAALPVLIGVVQDANPLDPTLPFGLVPSYVSSHASWLQDVFAATPPPLDTAPPLLR